MKSSDCQSQSECQSQRIAIRAKRTVRSLFVPNVKAAFTLLEMIVAGVLMSIMMVAVVGILRELLKETRSFKTSDVDVFTESLARQMRRDVVNARFYRQRPNQLELWGYVAQDPVTAQPLLTGAIVSYYLRPGTLGSTLFRSQQSRPLLSAANPTAVGFSSVDRAASYSQPVWCGIATFSLASSYIDQRDVSLLAPTAIQSQFANEALDTNAWLPLSTTVDLIVMGEQGQVLFRESIVRGEEL